MQAVSGSTPRLAPLDLDADSTANPNPQLSNESELARQDALEAEVQYLLRQTRLWRVINSAQWVAWGIVQAKVPGMEEGTAAMTVDGGKEAAGSPTPTASSPVDMDVDEGDEFDYLAYSQDRAMFFWADLLSLGLIKEDELPGLLVEHIKPRILDY